ncbi:arsenic resistance N-acetyltransferase ArsN2 [Porticoccaceae bacterium LTM1]|nr:arsenic resistance N-acetyltransferase ArsN2 [Porticoccaceae bacterium LTM1]
MNIEQIKAVEDVAELLQDSSLPTSDLKVDNNNFFFGIYDGDVLTSCVGVEVLGEIALLRSLAVLPSRQRKGDGAALVRHVEIFCASKGVKAIYLLTTTATSYFSMFGYASAPRESVLESVKSTTQYSSVCPGSAKIMFKKLDPFYS